MFQDKTLRTKYRQYLDCTQLQQSLGSTKARFTVATPICINKGVLDEDVNAANTPHDMFVDDDIYADVHKITHERVEQAAAASIEAILTTLGDSDLASR